MSKINTIERKKETGQNLTKDIYWLFEVDYVKNSTWCWLPICDVVKFDESSNTKIVDIGTILYYTLNDIGLCFRSLWIQREKELLQEVLCMGELGGPWRVRQTELLDSHLSLLKYYSHARQNLHNHSTTLNSFKQSSRKGGSRVPTCQL